MADISIGAGITSVIMNQLFRLVIGPALAGLVIAALILSYMIPATQEQAPAGDHTEQAAIIAASSKPQPSSGPVSYADAVNKATPAVVNIYTAKVIQQRLHPLLDDPVFRQFFGQKSAPKRQRLQSSLGSGVLINKNGYLLTNNHVIADADEIVVALQDGRESFATVVGTDPDTDLAVLKIDIINGPVIEMAPSEAIEVGDVALAIGNPFGVGQTVTMGIVSAIGRNHLGLTKFEDFIQTDAAINPGNSGGALINAYGQLIGINTAIFSKSGGSQGIGFAIPADLARKITRDIIEHGSVIRGWLGIEAQQVNSMLSRSFDLKQAVGVLVAEVHRNGPADIAGLRPGDILLKINGVQVIEARLAMQQITETTPGEIVNIEVLRDGATLQFKARIGTAPRNNYRE